MTGEEKRKKLKEEYLKELKARKQIVDDMRKQKYMHNINKALEEMTNAMDDDTDEWIAKLNGKSLIEEAKLDMAMGLDTTSSIEDPFADKKDELTPFDLAFGDHKKEAPTPTNQTGATEQASLKPTDEPTPFDDDFGITKTLGDIEK